ncbi:MAG TPA: hypothetical protein ENK43_03575 [Planctomycetes bacterium]|nr:hypothetical protein [Planctomycetota bacterium]
MNALTLLLSILTALAGSDFVDPKVVAIITGILIPIVNILLRFVTNQPISSEGSGRRYVRIAVFGLICAGFASTAVADVLLVTKSGYYLLKTGSDGVPYVEQIDQVIKLDEPEDPGPNPPQPPKDPFEKLKRLASSEAAKVNEPTTRKALAKVYGMVADRIESGDLDYSRAFEAVSAASDAVLGVTDSAGKWAPWRKAVSDEIARLQQQGKLVGQDGTLKALRAVEAGLDAEGLGENIDWERLLKLIELILKILLSFNNGGAG